MVEYKIFIDHQFTEIYNGEFSEYVINNIIKPLSKLSYDITISKNEDDTIDKLTTNKYDLIICTGYSAITYSSAFAKSGLKKTSKFIQIIYDMNAEKIIEYIDSANISKIISQKSKLIFMADYVITFSKEIEKEIRELYYEYNDIFHINDKVKQLDYIIDFKEYDRIKLPLKGNRYIIVNSSINGATFLMPEFRKLLDNIKEETPKFKIVLFAENLPKNIYNNIVSSDIKKYLILLTEIKQQELMELYKNAIVSIFPSTIDVNPEFIYHSINSDCITIINDNNLYYKEFFKNVSFYNEDENIIEIINEYLKTIKDTKKHFIEEQYKDLENININSINTIENLVNKIKITNNNTKRI